jgi:hypothetical protein
MNQGFLEVGLPTLIALVFVNFVWAWVVTAAKPPERSGNERIPDKADPDWKYLEEGGPDGVRKNVAEEIKPETKVAR